MDTCEWPLIVVRAPAAVDDVQLRSFITRYQQLLADSSGPYVLVMDLRAMTSQFSPSQRKMLAAESPERHRCQGNALVFDSVLMRAMLKAVLWLRPEHHETRVFRHLDAALDWGRARCAASLHPPRS